MPDPDRSIANVAFAEAMSTWLKLNEELPELQHELNLQYRLAEEDDDEQRLLQLQVIRSHVQTVEGLVAEICEQLREASERSQR